MALDTQSKVCLDIAVDHRIRLLFKPVSANSTEHSNHVSRIKSRGLSLKRSYHEIGVTAKLAGPEISRNSTKYLPDYQVLYSDALLNLLQASAEPMLFDSRLVEKSPGVFYETLLSSCLSAKCNDASLILRQMSRLQRRGWPDSVAWKNEAAIRDAAVSTLQFAENVLRIPEKSNDAQLVKAIRHCARSCQEHVVTGRSGRRPEYELDLRGTRDEFLKLATKIEALLLDFLLRNEKKALRQEDLLSSMMGKMNLGPAAVSKTPVSPLPAPAEKPRWWRRGRRS
ncbi:hypothetical protein HZS61_003036 [Fusarium oxysporum f. sp. conglutinans]|uniref:Uncharacterized protein n=1 Tax=Fusarium oxysporum f. sp. conglutinans TaxID=100902 RepID=A0A8H6LFY2_FUSOX|nr:hypothetical protein HZS61_003036 [Fusarium oxysporum f. sp. conglutinans]